MENFDLLKPDGLQDLTEMFGNPSSDNELKLLYKSHARYEIVRKLNVQQFAELYQKNIKTGIPFDDLVDELLQK